MRGAAQPGGRSGLRRLRRLRGGACIPGRPPCYSLPEPCTFIGYLINNLYECLCCPDPCYQPKWVPEANASFFVDYARTRTVTRLRFDRGLDLQFPDRNEYFYKQVILGKFGSGGKRPRPFIVNGVRFRADPSLNFNQLYFYQEVAAGKASFFVEVPPYRQISPLFGQSHAGFSDMNLGTKAMIFDCEMLQLTMQFRTFLPTGNAMEGLGTGHVSLEPSLLGALRLAEQTYFQGQLAQWIPLGGTSGIAGGILHYHFSLNQTLCRVTPDSPLIGTFEMNGWSFQNGGFTNPVGRPEPAAAARGERPDLLQPGPRLATVGLRRHRFRRGDRLAGHRPPLGRPALPRGATHPLLRAFVRVHRADHPRSSGELQTVRTGDPPP